MSTGEKSLSTALQEKTFGGSFEGRVYILWGEIIGAFYEHMVDKNLLFWLLKSGERLNVLRC